MEPIRTEVAQAILSRLAKGVKKEEDQDAFSLADVDRDGFVSRSEFQNFMNDCPGNFSRDQLKKLFDYLDDAHVGRLEREEFMRAAIVFYRVSRPSVDLVQTMGVAQGKLVRKLDVNEILELIEGPIKEINKVVRVKCRAMKDGAIGWGHCDWQQWSCLCWAEAGSLSGEESYNIDWCSVGQSMHKYSTA